MTADPNQRRRGRCGEVKPVTDFNWRRGGLLDAGDHSKP
jgi:hypothetical protein